MFIVLVIASVLFMLPYASNASMIPAESETTEQQADAKINRLIYLVRSITKGDTASLQKKIDQIISDERIEQSKKENLQNKINTLEQEKEKQQKAVVAIAKNRSNYQIGIVALILIMLAVFKLLATRSAKKISALENTIKELTEIIEELKKTNQKISDGNQKSLSQISEFRKTLYAKDNDLIERAAKITQLEKQLELSRKQIGELTKEITTVNELRELDVKHFLEKNK